MRIGKAVLLFLVVVVFFLSGCSRRYIVNVDSINDRSAITGKNFVIVSGNKNIDASDLQFMEYACYVAAALEKKGYTAVDSIGKADLEIYMSYGVGEAERHVYSYTTPVWGQTGGETTTIANIIKEEDGSTKYISSTSYTPDYGITGYQERTDVYTTYPKYIILDAYDLKLKQENKKLKQLWKTSISNHGGTKELRKFFPIMITAAQQYIGENTGEEISLSVGEEDEAAVKCVR
ncbi:MAG: hypothetical protein CVV21_09820 [Candidatus Goldiibacteriota bacterium HGW-Goldbacteria-1]|jgi:hypothetical protein|nr:MAG: hypothetical protein CVV21_09820 [Candidatus Goldiibacteriota bacterium HGW-Goldbacteria-1]